MNFRLPIILVSVAAALGVFFKLYCDAHPAFDLPGLLVANFLMCGLSLAGWFMLRRRSNERAQVFVQGVYGATMLRLFVCIIGILAYALINKPNVHRPSLFMMFGIYIIYMVIETVYFSRLTRKV